jgi:hypothetical protein
MPQGVTPHPLRDAGRPGGFSYVALDRGFGQVVPAHYPRSWIRREAAGRKYVLPLPGLRGARTFPRKSEWHFHLAESLLQILGVQQPRAAEMSLKISNHGCEQHRPAVLPTLPLSNGYLTLKQVQIFDANPERLDEP